MGKWKPKGKLYNNLEIKNQIKTNQQ